MDNYFGIPGHCYDIDGYLWHDPGQCENNNSHLYIRGPCCGYDTAEDDRHKDSRRPPESE